MAGIDLGVPVRLGLEEGRSVELQKKVEMGDIYFT